MKRVMVLGCCGAGKSTFSKKLAAITNLKVIHLDQHYWKPSWVESSKEEWTKKAKALAEKPAWIMDGNYGSTIDLRIKRADTIIYLDCSTIKCLWRITKRILKYKGRSRPDMPSGCKERFDLEFYHYVATFNLVRRKKLLEKLSGLKEQKKVLVFRDDAAVEAYLQEVDLNEN